MQKKTILFLASVVVILTGVVLLIWNSSRPRRLCPIAAVMAAKQARDRAVFTEGFSTNFQEVFDRLTGLRSELFERLNAKTGVYMEADFEAFFDLPFKPMLESIESAMRNPVSVGVEGAPIPESEFFLGGDTMDEPIRRIADRSPRLYSILQKTGFLVVIGRFIASSAWLSMSKNSTPGSLQAFWQCTTRIDWNDPAVWAEMNGQTCLIAACLQRAQ